MYPKRLRALKGPRVYLPSEQEKDFYHSTQVSNICAVTSLTLDGHPLTVPNHYVLTFREFFSEDSENREKHITKEIQPIRHYFLTSFMQTSAKKTGIGKVVKRF